MAIVGFRDFAAVMEFLELRGHVGREREREGGRKRESER